MKRLKKYFETKEAPDPSKLNSGENPPEVESEMTGPYRAEEYLNQGRQLLVRPKNRESDHWDLTLLGIALAKIEPVKGFDIMDADLLKCIRDLLEPSLRRVDNALVKKAK